MGYGEFLLTGARVFSGGRFQTADVAVSAGKIVSRPPASFDPKVIPLGGMLLLPGFADVHVHFREPGFSYKETVATGSAAAAAGGYSDVFTMPNLNPVPDALENLRPQLDAIDLSATVNVHPFGAITKGEKGEELSDMAALAPFVAGFSDDGHGVQDGALMRDAMTAAKALDKPIVAHCEVNSLLVRGGCVHDGEWARAHGFTGISSASEWKMVERDLDLVRDAKCQYHVCHVSTRESIELVRDAKKEGLPVSCETGPHYLVMSDADLRDEGRFKMNPPIRSAADRDTLLEGLADGTVDCIATDHAPHSAEEKARGLAGSAFGVVGLETAFAVLYTRLVKTGVIALETLVDRLAIRPHHLFGLKACAFADGDRADLTAVATGNRGKIDPIQFLSKGKATPFEGWEVDAEIALAMCGGNISYVKGKL